MSTQKNIIKEAKKSLAGENWSKSIGGGIVYCCVPIIISLVYSIVNILFDNDIFDLRSYADGIDTEKIVMLCAAAGILIMCLLFTPLMLGYKKLSYQIAKNGEAGFADMFYFCKSSRYFKAVRLYLFKVVYWLFFAFIYYLIPAVITVYSDDIFSYINLGEKYNTLLWIAVGVLYFISTVLFISTALKQYLAGYILCDDDEATVSKAISRSSSLMRGNRKKIVKLFIRMSLWIISCALVIPIIFVLPYVKTAFAVCSRLIIHHNSDEQSVVTP